MKKYISLVLIALFAAACGASNRGETQVTTLEGFTQGTYYRIVMIGGDTVRLQRQIDSLFTAIDNSMSIFNPDSRLSRLNRNETDVPDNYIAYCITTAHEVSRASGGLYDITVKPLVEAWGFAAREGDSVPNIDSLLEFVGYEKIRLENGRLAKSDPRVQLDLNSIAKGYSADLVGQLIESRGVTRYLVEIGGEIVVKGMNKSGKPWLIGVDKPVEGNFLPGAETQTMLSVTDCGVATSGNYRNFRYDDQGHKIVHTINPVTGASTPGNVLSATVVAPNCALADAMGTALMASGLEGAMRLLDAVPSVGAILIYAGEDGTMETYVSPVLKKYLVE